MKSSATTDLPGMLRVCTSVPFIYTEFFPFGRRFGDKVIPGAIDRSEEVALPSTVTYYQKMEDKLFVIIISLLNIVFIIAVS